MKRHYPGAKAFPMIAFALLLCACTPEPDAIAQCLADGKQLCHKNCEVNECDLFCKTGTSGRTSDDVGPIGQCTIGDDHCRNPC